MTFPRIEQLTLSPRSPKTQDQMQNDYNRTSSAVKTWMIVVIVIVLLVVIGGGVFTAVVLCRIRRRNARQRNASAYYGAKSHDVEMTPPTYSAPNSNQVAQLPTNDEGGEDLKGNPKLEFEGNPVYQLENHDVSNTEVPQGIFLI